MSVDEAVFYLERGEQSSRYSLAVWDLDKLQF